MEPKKSKKANLERKKGLFLQIGFVISLGLVLLAFEWTSRPEESKDFGRKDSDDVVQESVPVTRQEQRKEPPPPPPPKTTEVIQIVENDVNIEDELILEATEADQDTRVNIDAFADEGEEEEDMEVFVRVEDMPTFQGQGLNAFRNYIQQNITYPNIAQDNGIQGTVYIKFIVDKDGSVTNVTLLRGVDPSLDKAAMKAIKNAPKWEPGKQRGKPVRVSCTVPIAFLMQ